MTAFTLDVRLRDDSAFIADGPLSQVRLMNDSRFPWLILVPRIENAVEWIDLNGAQQRLWVAEINMLAKPLRAEPSVQKLNIGTLGNIVRQLHLHVIGRREGDAAWPGPVWGSGPAKRYAEDELQARIHYWHERLG